MRMKDEEFEEVIRINLEAAFRLMRAAAKPMMKARFGRIISDYLGRGRHRQSRPGELRRVKGRVDRDDQGSRAGAREPEHHRERDRARLHDFGHDRRPQRPAARGHPPRIPMGAMGSGDDIGAAVAYLASKEAGYVTGQTLHVNGGMAMP